MRSQEVPNFCKAKWIHDDDIKRQWKNREKKIEKSETQYASEPSYAIPFSHFVRKSTVGGVGEMSLPLSLGIVATDICQGDNDGAI